MKPEPPFADRARRRFPQVDLFFQSDLSNWRGGSSGGDDDDSPAHRFNKFNREFLLESRRERDREMLVLGVVMLVAAWPVFYMIYSVITLLIKGNPLHM